MERRDWRAHWRRAYDYSQSTKDNYQGTQSNRGPFAAIRDSLDERYHGRYRPSRQLAQDKLVERVLGSCSCLPQVHPWIVFTAGAMGAGKSRTVEWMSERGIFPLDNLVHIDPDRFRTSFPEWAAYVARDRCTAGALTHEESGYLVEIAQEAALRAGKHVWVDGSLRDGGWYARVMRAIKARHPRYRIAVLHVQAEEAVILERVRRRGAVTGREVPEHEVRDSIARVPEAVNTLAPLVNFLAIIDNSSATPRLIKYCDADTCFLVDGASFRDHDLEIGSWDQIESRFRSVPRASAVEASREPQQQAAGVLQRAWHRVTSWLNKPAAPAAPAEPPAGRSTTSGNVVSKL